ncbi:MAG: HepT-like ribonuclease domain-containing protein [Janthinobacterium lividum]
MVRRRGTIDRLQDILAAGEDVLASAEPLDAAAFAMLPKNDRLTYRALKNAFAEIGKAVKLLPLELLARHSEVDWRGWAGLHDIVSHRYSSLELSLLLPTITEGLLVLLAVVKIELVLLS